MACQSSESDRAFMDAFEALQVVADDFDHAAHVRLAYVYLCELSDDQATDRMKQALLAFLTHLDVGLTKYHETLTTAWVRAVRHFMNKTGEAGSYAEFIDANPGLLDPAIMLSHYSAETLYSDRARQRFIEPDIERIP